MHRRTTFLFVAALFGWFLLAPVAAAEASGWEQPLPLAAPQTSPNDYQLVVTSTGETVAAWIEQNHASIRAFAAVVRADGTFEPAVELARDLAGCVLDIATDAHGNVIVALSHADGQIDVFRRAPGGSFGAPEIVRPAGSGSGAPKVAMNPSGDAAVLTREGSSTSVLVSRGGGPWSDERWVSGGEELGGYDVAMTPAGDVVAVWISDGQERPDRISTVNATTLRVDGTQSAVQVLRSSTSTKTCPQVEANALGQVAALWHEIEHTQCGEWGADVLALRPAGATAFETPQIVPGAQSAAALGRLGLADDGRLTVTYDGANGGQIVSGPFGGALSATEIGTAPVALGTDPAGADIVAVRDATASGSIATRRHHRSGQLGAPQPLRADGAIDEYMAVDEGGQRTAALVFVEGRGLHVIPGTPASEAPPAAPPAASGGASPAPQGGAITPPSPAFAARVRHVRVRGRSVRVSVGCIPRCTATVRLTLTGRTGKRVRLTSRARSLTRRAVVAFRLSRAAQRRLGGRRYALVARLSAIGPSGERAEAVVRRRR